MTEHTSPAPRHEQRGVGQRIGVRALIPKETLEQWGPDVIEDVWSKMMDQVISLARPDGPDQATLKRIAHQEYNDQGDAVEFTVEVNYRAPYVKPTSGPEWEVITA